MLSISKINNYHVTFLYIFHCFTYYIYYTIICESFIFANSTKININWYRQRIFTLLGIYNFMPFLLVFAILIFYRHICEFASYTHISMGLLPLL